MLLKDVTHRGYQAHREFGNIVWYKTTSSVAGGKSAKSGKEIKYGTRISRIVTSASNISEAIVQLDRALSKPKTVPEIKAGPGQQSMF